MHGGVRFGVDSGIRVKELRLKNLESVYVGLV